MHAISFELDYKRVQQQYQLSEYEITGRLIRLFDTEGFYMYRHNIFCTKNKDPLKRIYNMATKLGQLEWFGSIVSEIECFEMRNKSELIDIITKSTDQLVIARNAAAGSLLLHKVLAEKAEAASAEPLD